MTPIKLIDLLGVNAVLLPIPKKLKYPSGFKNWQKTTFQDTQTDPYQRKLNSHGNTGVLLGRVSQNLISIDFDDEQELDLFIVRNPALSKTLRTKGKRGANLWLVINGDYPKSQPLKNSHGEPIGEWRADGNQTIIQGIHPEGEPYSILVKAKPLIISFIDIDWGDILFKAPCHIDDIDGIDHTEIQITQTNSKENKPSLSLTEKEHLADTALTSLKQNKDLYKLYSLYIDRKFTPCQGERNSQLVSMMTFLSRSVSKQRSLELAEAYYNVNQDVFADPLDQHMREAQAQLDATLETWASELSESQRAIIRGFPTPQREAYRICRDLAFHKNNQTAGGTFFLSCADLGRRLAVDMKRSHRILRQLEAMNVISVENKGTRHAKGASGRATVYRWTQQI